MHQRRSLSFLLIVLLALSFSLTGRVRAAPSQRNEHQVCPGRSGPGTSRCHAWAEPDASASPIGLTPSRMKSVYHFSTSLTAGAGKRIAIVDAYDLPTAEADLNAFSAKFGLPACTTANGCFKKINQNGGTSSYPKYDGGWGLEIAMDIEWAHAIAPAAKILLVEASNNLNSNLFAAEDMASAHAAYVSNSWGGSEFSGETSIDSYFKKSGISFFFSAGDGGLPAEYPSASPYVISVGGTTLNFSGTTYVSETGWSHGGGGCSAYETATSAQAALGGYPQVKCGGKRATPDVSLDADPNSGAAVYDSSSYYGQSGWYQVGGTSLSAPMWAARSAVAGVVMNSSFVYNKANIPFRDIHYGNNGAPCLTGYDLCAGRGSWVGSTP